MPTFKPKANKKIKVCKKTSTTLDNKHKEITNEFTNNECYYVPKLKDEKNNLKQKLINGINLSIEEAMEIKDRIKEINETIKSIKNKKIDYYLDNSKYIFEYFENKKNIDNNDNNKVFGTKNNALNNFFKIKNIPDKDNSDNDTTNNSSNDNIVRKYLCNIDETFLDINLFVKSTDVCQECFKGEMIPLDDEGLLICNNCSVSIPFLIENEKPSYKEPPKEVCFYAYKKINHFKEIISQFQGKETTQIPDEIIQQIKQQIKKERIDLNTLNYSKTKELLKKLSLNKYYEHIAFIKNKLGIKPPVFSPELEQTLCNLFIEIQVPYAKVCPNYRVNFLNYYYCLYKFCELLEEYQYLDEIPMLTDEKLIEQDEIWKDICFIINWEFKRTVLRK
jgi:hypothetical protein